MYVPKCPVPKCPPNVPTSPNVPQMSLSSNQNIENRIMKNRPMIERKLTIMADIPKECLDNENITTQIIEVAQNHGFNISELHLLEEKGMIHIIFKDVEHRSYRQTVSCFKDIFSGFNINIKE